MKYSFLPHVVLSTLKLVLLGGYYSVLRDGRFGEPMYFAKSIKKKVERGKKLPNLNPRRFVLYL